MTDNGGLDIHIPKRLSWATVGGFIILVAAATAGYLTLNARVTATEEAVAEFVHAVSADRAFHVDQRVRIWDRVNQLEQAIQNQREATAAITARLTEIDRNISRILDILQRRADLGPPP